MITKTAQASDWEAIYLLIKDNMQTMQLALGFNEVSRNKGILALTMPRQQLMQKLNLL